MRKAALIILFLIAGCAYSPTGKPPHIVADDLDHEFNGQPVNNFFYQYGLPEGDFEYSDGNAVYKWASFHSATIPADISVRRYTAPDGTYEVADNYSGVPQAQYCELRIYTDASNVIQGFAVAVDTMGKWGASRCSEIFEEVF